MLKRPMTMGSDKHPLDWANGSSLVMIAITASVALRGKSQWRVNGRKEREPMSIVLQRTGLWGGNEQGVG